MNNTLTFPSEKILFKLLFAICFNLLISEVLCKAIRLFADSEITSEHFLHLYLWCAISLILTLLFTFVLMGIIIPTAISFFVGIIHNGKVRRASNNDSKKASEHCDRDKGLPFSINETEMRSMFIPEWNNFDSFLQLLKEKLTTNSYNLRNVGHLSHLLCETTGILKPEFIIKRSRKGNFTKVNTALHKACGLKPSSSSKAYYEDGSNNKVESDFKDIMRP